MPVLPKNISDSTNCSAHSALLDVPRAIGNYDGVAIAWDNRSVHSENASFGQAIYRSCGYCGPRIQRDFELVVLHSGEAAVTVDDDRRSLGIGSVALFLPGHREYFEFSKTRESHHSWCAVAPSRVPRKLASELLHAPPSVACSEFLNRNLSSAFVLERARNAHFNQVIDRLALLLFTEYLHLSEASRNRTRRTDPVNKALNYIENHISEDACLENARRAAGVSRNSLIHHFAHELHATPGRYLWKLRTEKGVSMLAKTGLTVAEIAYQCGFKSPFHFSRLVKEQQGISPREVRKRAWLM